MNISIDSKIVNSNIIELTSYNQKIEITNSTDNIIVEINIPADIVDHTFLFFLTLKENVTINYHLGTNSKIRIINIYKNKENIQKIKHCYNMDANAELTAYHLNIVSSDIDESVTFNLNGNRSKIKYYLASLAINDNKKNEIIYAHHLAPGTKSDIKTYSIAKDRSLQTVKCTSHIEKTMSKSEAHQELRLLVFDKGSKAISDPILLIDENDIKASHANAVGMLDPDQIFYLRTRGLTATQARKLICMGYFKSVIDAIEDEELQADIISRIEKEMGE